MCSEAAVSGAIATNVGAAASASHPETPELLLGIFAESPRIALAFITRPFIDLPIG